MIKNNYVLTLKQKHTPIILLTGTQNALFKYGSRSIDFATVMEMKCPDGFRRITLDPIKKCRDRYKIAENNSLLLPEALKDRKSSYDQNEYCIDINYKATTRFEHFPEICQDTRIQDSRLV